MALEMGGGSRVSVWRGRAAGARDWGTGMIRMAVSSEFPAGQPMPPIPNPYYSHAPAAADAEADDAGDLRSWENQGSRGRAALAARPWVA